MENYAKYSDTSEWNKIKIQNIYFISLLKLIHQGGGETLSQLRRIAKPMSRTKQRVTVEMLLYSATPLPGSSSRVSNGDFTKTL